MGDCGAPAEDTVDGSPASNTVLWEGLLALLVKAGYSLTSDTLLEKSLDVGDDLEVFMLTFAGDLEFLATSADVLLALLSVGDDLEAVACFGDDFCERLNAASSSAMRFLSSIVDPWNFGTDPDPGDSYLWLMDPDPAIFVSDLLFWRYIYII